MNIQQLEYILAVDATRHFARAAEACFVTQPTLSMMIQKLEEELGVQIFDRSKQPIIPTKEGIELLKQARLIVAQVQQMKYYAKELNGELKGELRMGIIPTLAPYLLPHFLSSFSAAFPEVKLFVNELVTEEICQRLADGTLDMGLLATPLGQNNLIEHRLFLEEFMAYTSKKEVVSKKRYLLPHDINPARLWLLEEGHCFRNQVLQFCELRNSDYAKRYLSYEAGSIETLINLVDAQEGITIVPWLATLTMSASQKKRLLEFAKPKPVREISLVVHQHYPRKKLLSAMLGFIKKQLPEMPGSGTKVEVLDAIRS